LDVLADDPAQLVENDSEVAFPANGAGAEVVDVDLGDVLPIKKGLLDLGDEELFEIGGLAVELELEPEVAVIVVDEGAVAAAVVEPDALLENVLFESDVQPLDLAFEVFLVRTDAVLVPEAVAEKLTLNGEDAALREDVVLELQQVALQIELHRAQVLLELGDHLLEAAVLLALEAQFGLVQLLEDGQLLRGVGLHVLQGVEERESERLGEAELRGEQDVRVADLRALPLQVAVEFARSPRARPVGKDAGQQLHVRRRLVLRVELVVPLRVVLVVRVLCQLRVANLVVLGENQIGVHI